MNATAPASNAKSGRKGFLDLLRVIAAFGVVVFHLVGGTVQNDPASTENMRYIASLVTDILSWCVPVFFIITGYLWLQTGKACTYSKMFLAVRRFVLVLFTVGFAYALIERFFALRTLSLELLLRSLGDVLTGDLWAHMWYLYAAIGIYLVLPVIKPFFDTRSTKEVTIVVTLLLFFNIIVQAMSNTFGYVFPVELPLAYPLFYVCAGGLLSRIDFSRRAAVCAAGGLLISSALFLISSLSGLKPVLTAISALSVFVLAAGFCGDRHPHPAIAVFSAASFGIYLFHPFFINVMTKLFGIFPLRFMPVFTALISSALIFLVSACAAIILRKIKFVKKYIL